MNLKRPSGAVSQNAAVARRTDAGGRVQRSRGRPGFHHPCTPAARLSSSRMKCQRAVGGGGFVGRRYKSIRCGEALFQPRQLSVFRAGTQGREGESASARRHKDADPCLPPQVLTAAAAAATRRQAALIKRSERISSEVKTALLRSFAPQRSLSKELQRKLTRRLKNERPPDLFCNL